MARLPRHCELQSTPLPAVRENYINMRLWYYSSALVQLSLRLFLHRADIFISDGGC